LSRAASHCDRRDQYPEVPILRCGRPGRFDREIEIGVPNTQARLQILKIHTRAMPLAADVDLPEIAEHSHASSAPIRSAGQEVGMIACAVSCHPFPRYRRHCSRGVGHAASHARRFSCRPEGSRAQRHPRILYREKLVDVCIARRSPEVKRLLMA